MGKEKYWLFRYYTSFEKECFQFIKKNVNSIFERPTRCITGLNARFLVIVSLTKFKRAEVHLALRKMPRLWVTSGGTFARERSRKHFTDRMKQSEASRHQPAGKPLSLQADAAGDMRGRQYAPHMRVGGEPHATQQENSDAEIDSRPTGSKQQVLATNAHSQLLLSVF